MKPRIHYYFLSVLMLFLITDFSLAQERILGENPIIRDIFTADPAALVYEDTVYLYVGHDEATGDEMFNINEWLAYSSTDMKSWVPHGTVMKPTDFEWSSGNAWASQVIEKDGKFWFYTTTMHGPPINRDAIGVAVSDSPIGPFRDAKGSALVVDSMTPTPEDPHDWDDIDPTAFTDDDGTTWLSWGNNHLYLAKLKPNMIELDGPIRELYLPNFTEGPWIHKREDLYYLTYACFAHQNMWEKICYSTAPEIKGPWTYRGIITGQNEHSYTIHPAIIEYQNQWYFFYHTGQLSIGEESGAIGRRAVSIEYLYYNEDGTIKPIKKTKEGLSAPTDPPEEYRGPVYNPEDSLVTVDSDLTIGQHSGVAARRWPGDPVFTTADDPYQNAIYLESFNGEEAATSIGQTFKVGEDLRLERISLYAGDGFGTGANRDATIALYDLGNEPAGDSYEAATNILGEENGMRINYKPQAPGLLHLDLSEKRQPPLKAGHTYVIELQGVRNSAPFFLRRSRGDIYADGAGYRNRILITAGEDSSTSDFVMALYGSEVRE